MNAVVTGSSGLLGGEVMRALARRNVEVQPLRARFSPDSSTQVRIDVGELASVFAKSSPDYVFHLAGIASAESIAEFYRVNTLFAATLLDALDAARLARVTLVLIGSAAEYGPLEGPSLPAREDGPVEPADYYGSSKLAQTILGVSASRRGRRVVLARPSNIIGPHMRKQLAIGSYVRQLGEIARGERHAVLEVGNLAGYRDLIDVRDAGELIVRLADRAVQEGRVVNVSTGKPTAMSDVVRVLLSLFEKRGFGQVRVEQRNIPSTSTSSNTHFSSNQRLLDLLGPLDYTPLVETLAWILDTELKTGPSR